MTYRLRIIDNLKVTVPFLSDLFQGCMCIPSSQAEQLAFLLKKNKELNIFEGYDKKFLTAYSEYLTENEIENYIVDAGIH